MAGRVAVVDCSQPFTGDYERAVTRGELGREAMLAFLSGDREQAEEKFEALLEVETLPTVDEALEELR